VNGELDLCCLQSPVSSLPPIRSPQSLFLQSPVFFQSAITNGSINRES
jgi:hypothetical protein